MKLGLSLQASLQQTLTPQQIQYLKLLQLPVLQLEQQVRTELETNPMLEEVDEEGMTGGAESAPVAEADTSIEAGFDKSSIINSEGPDRVESDSLVDTFNNSDNSVNDGHDFDRLLVGADHSDSLPLAYSDDDDDDGDASDYLYRDTPTLLDDYREQLHYLHLSSTEIVLGDYIIGNVDDDGYLRRPLEELVDEVNSMIAEHNLALHSGPKMGLATSTLQGISDPLSPASLSVADKVLRRIHSLDPPGFGARNVRECLLAQLRAISRPNAAHKLATMILEQAYEPFVMKHFAVLEKQLGVTNSYLKEALEVIRHLNPRPGMGTIAHEANTVTPDFVVERNETADDFIIIVNDSRLPALRVSTAYERLRKEARFRKFNKETRDYLRQKYEDAKFLIQAIRQRKHTMLRVMTSIVGLQRAFFELGSIGLRPLIYRDVAEISGLDISTVCRIVNGKYVLTSYGTFELRYFFSEALLMDDGEEVSTRIVKQKIRELIETENKEKPLSDEKLMADLKKLGFNVARRTIAKYREQLRIPVARLRRELA